MDMIIFMLYMAVMYSLTIVPIAWNYLNRRPLKEPLFMSGGAVVGAALGFFVAVATR